ncbi:MAG: ABC transporter substrate-binding protein [Candidatus Nanopelagicaceae bacterium]
MKVTRVKIAVAAVAALALGFTMLSPAQSATRSTVILHETNPITGLNCSTSATNSTTCAAVSYLQGAGFYYYNNKKEVVPNTTFGTYKIVKNTKTDFRVQYTVNPGRVWSDGVPITGVDLLLSHVLSSGAYSIAAGLGDPKSKTAKPAFESLGYGGTYDDNVVGEPELSADQMKVTIRYKMPIANWDLQGPGPSPVHTMIQINDGATKLGTVAEGNAAKAKFLTAFNDKDTTVLKALGKIWSSSYTITTVNSSTNPLLLVSNGGYIIDNAVAKTSVTLKRNAKYNSGPALQGDIDTIVFKFIGDGTAAAQALANGELDVYAGQATADGVAKLKAIKGVNVVGKEEVAYEHWDLHYDTVPGEDPYTGIFSVKDGAKSLALRRAFLLGLPREEILSKLIAPINGVKTPIRSTWLAPGSAAYDKLVAANGSSYYVQGTQEERNKRALGLVLKYYPDALKNPIKVNVLVPGNNPRRAAEFALAKANLAKVGFDLVGDVRTDWPSQLGVSKYDVYFFAWVASSVTQKQSSEIFLTNGGNNITGYSNSTVDSIIGTLDVPMSTNALVNKYIQIERITNNDAITQGVFIHPGILAVNENLKGIKPSPLSPQIVWNYWEWKY